MRNVNEEMKEWKMVVLDDDPTGIPTVHGCLLITQWDEDSVRKGFADAEPFFYILTNTRAMTREDAEQVTHEAMEMVIKVNQDYGYRLIVVSRSDSCLRGHFPLETDVMRSCLLSHGYDVMEKTPFCPAFIEAGRVTIDGVHYMRDGERLIPVSETEFARDNVFAYHTSVLRDYIQEKSANPDDYIIVNAQGYDELRAFADTVLSDGIAEHVVIRSSSSLPKAISGYIQVASVGHIAVFSLGRGFYIVDENLLKLCRGFDIRVSKSKVKDILCPILCGKLCTCLKHLADPG